MSVWVWGMGNENDINNNMQADTEGSAPTSLEHVTARNIIETCEQHMPICKATILILYYRNQY